jgi:hypothetical protein
MHPDFGQQYVDALRQTRTLLADFATRFQPISMATSAETGAFLAVLRNVLEWHAVVETGSGFSSALLPDATHAEDNVEYGKRVQEWLAGIGVPPGVFCDYGALYRRDVSGRFLMFLDGNLATREATFGWLRDKLELAVIVIDDAQAGTFAPVQAVLDELHDDPRGTLVDAAAWTRDGYGRSAALWIGKAAGFPPDVLQEINQHPPRILPTDLPARLLLCINDTPENARWKCTVRTLTSIGITVDLQKHSLWVVDNGSTCPNTNEFLNAWCPDQLGQGAQVRIFRLPENLYATYAFNRLLFMVPAGEYVIRLENDIEFHTPGWPSIMVRFLADSGFGLVSAKPVDLPDKALGHPAVEIAGRNVQVVDEVPGFCTAFAPDVRLRLGALASAGCYIEDVLTSRRVQVLGRQMAFLDSRELRCFHVDRVLSSAYAHWKQGAVANERAAMIRAMDDWTSGRRSPHVPFEVRSGDGFHELRF